MLKQDPQLKRVDTELVLEYLLKLCGIQLCGLYVLLSTDRVLLPDLISKNIIFLQENEEEDLSSLKEKGDELWCEYVKKMNAAANVKLEGIHLCHTKMT